MRRVHKLAAKLKKLKPFRLRVVHLKGRQPCGLTHWTEPPTIEIRRGTRFGEENALLHEFAHIYSGDHLHTMVHRNCLILLVKQFFGSVHSYPWQEERLHQLREEIKHRDRPEKGGEN